MIYHGDAMSYIKETPIILSEIIKNSDEIVNAPALSRLDNAGDIIITGTGSSYNAGIMVREAMQTILNRRVTVVYPSELDSELKISSKDALVIGISQQGTSVSVIEALDKANKLNRRTIAMTGETGTEITRHGDQVIMIECGEEDAGATTKGFSTTGFTLLLLAIALIGKDKDRVAEWKNKMEEIPIAVCKALNLDKLDQIAEKLDGFKQLMIISSDCFKNLMPEIVLKFSETCRKPVVGMAAEMFCHGMYNAVQQDTTFLFISMDGDKKIQKLNNYYKEYGNRTVLWNISHEKSALEALFSATIATQCIWVQTSRKMGVDLNIPKDPDFHKIMGSKIEIDADCKRENIGIM